MTDNEPSLDGAWEKYRRAGELLDDFLEEAEHARAAVAGTVVTRTRYDPDYPRWLVEVVEAPEVSLRLSSVAGDVIHNLRSALDFMVYELVAKVTGSRWEKSQWPIASTFEALYARKLNLQLQQELVNGGREDLWALIEYYQPASAVDELGSGEDIYTHMLRKRPLRVLQFLSNQDKHRLLIEPFFNIEELSPVTARCIRDCENPREIQLRFYTLRADAAPLIQFTADITGDEPGLTVDMELVPEPVGFVPLPGAAEWWMTLIAGEVRNILEDFATEF